jgi:phage terminase large subunit GpA-like protein
VKLWPPQREIANSIGNADVERVTWLKAVRSGYTFLLTAAVARYLTAQARSSKKRR